MNRWPVLEGLALALRVSPDDLTGQPYAPADPLSEEAHAGIAAVEAALDAYDLGVDPDVTPRPWPELAAEVQRLNDVLRADADYASLGTVIPNLLAELHATYVRAPSTGETHWSASFTPTGRRPGSRNAWVSAAFP